MGWSQTDTLCLNILIFFLVPLVYAAPLSEISTDNLGYYPVSDKTGCYYNFQHYDEGDRIFTNEPCLNCTCHNKMLMCYLRVCPFVKAYGENCRVEKRADLCCPIITCPEVPLIPSNVSQSSEDTALGRPDNYGCTIDNLFYADGVRIPGDPNKPCELCYCIRNKTACVMQECTLKIQGCTPVYHKDICCPIRYNCDDRPALEGPADPEGGLIFTTSTTTTTTTTTTVPTTTVAINDCVYNNAPYGDGERIDEYNEKKPCETCYCMKGHIVCAVQECAPTPLEKINCTALPPVEGDCCPSQYECENMSGELPTSTELYDPSTVKEMNGITSTPIGATSQSNDDQVTSSESGQSIDESVSSSSEEPESEKLTTARIAPVDTTTEIHTELDQSSTEASGIPEDKISTSEHDKEQHPTIPSESQVTTSEPEKIQTELIPEKATSIDIKEGGITTSTQGAIIEHQTEEISNEDIPSEDVSSDDHGEELSEEVTTKKNHVIITTEIPTTSQVNDLSPSESTGTQTEDSKITTSNQDQQTSSESSGVTNHITDTSEIVSPQVTTEWTKPQESSETVSSEAPTFVPNTQDASENVPSESTTKAQLENNSIHTTASQIEGETVKESTEIPQIQNLIPTSDEESGKPETTAQEESSSTIPNISTEKAIEAGNQQSEEKIVTTNPTETEKATDIVQENTERGEKIPENISTEAPLTQETTIKDENSIDKTDAENISEDTKKPNTIADITTEKEITTGEQATEAISLVEQSKESTTMEAPRITDNSSNEDEVSISTTPKNIETQNSETTVGINHLPENSSDKTLTEGEEKIPTESVQPLEQDISPSSESSLSSTSDETSTPFKSETEAEAEPGISSTEGISGSDEKSGETISEQGVKHDSDTPQELPTTEASKGSDQKITTEIPDETTGAKLTESTGEGHISSTEAIKETDPEISGPSESSSQPQDIVEIYDASTTPESEIVNENGPDKSSTEIPDSYISPVSGQQTTNASPEPTEAAERVTEHSLGTEKSETIPQSGQVTNAPTEITPQVSKESAQTQETKSPATSSSLEDLVPTTTEQAASNSETTERLVPGEGSCLVDGVTYENNAHIDPINQCQVSCKCFNSIVKCESVTCDPPSADLGNCMAVYPGPDSCCPIYNCATPGDQSMESGSQKKENENQKPAVTESYIPDSTDSDIIATTINTVEEEDKKEISPNETPVTNPDVTSSGSKETDAISNESSTLPPKEYEPSSPSTDTGADSSSESDKKATDEMTTESNRKEESAEENTEDKKVADNKVTESSTASNSDTSEEVTIYIGGVPSTESPDFDQESSTSPKQQSASDDVTITEANKTEPSGEPELTTEKEISPTTSSKDQYSKPSESVESSSTESIEQDPNTTGKTPSEQSDNEQDNLLTTPSSISEKEHEELGNKPFTSAPKLDSTLTPQDVTGEEIISISTTEKVIHPDDIPENTNQSTEKSLDNGHKEETTSGVEDTEPFTSKPSSETPPQEITEPNEKLSEADSTTKSAGISSSEYTPQDIITTEKQLSEEQSPFTSSPIDRERETTEKAPIEEVKEPFTSRPSTEQIAVQPATTTQSSEKQDEPIDEVSNDFDEGEENVEPTSPEKSPEKEIPVKSSVSSSSEGSNVGVTENSEIGEKQDNTAPSEEETTEPEHVTIADDSQPEMPDNDNLVTEVPIIPSSQESDQTSTEVQREPEITTSQVNVASEETTKAVEGNEATQASVKPHESSSQVFDLTTKIETTSIATSNEDSKDVSDTPRPTEKQTVVENEISTESVPSVEKVPEVTEKNIVAASTESIVSSEKESGLSTSVENEITTVGTKEISTATDNISNPTTVSSIISGINSAEQENKQTTEKSIESAEPSQSTVAGSQENDQSSPFTDKIPVEDVASTTASPKDISLLPEIITEATEKSSESTEKSSEASDKSPESTEKSSESTEKSSESTEKSSESTEKSSESDEKSSESTEKSSQPAEESPSGETNSQTIQPPEEETTKSVIYDASNKPTESSGTTIDKIPEGIEENDIHLTEGPALVDQETEQVSTQKSVESVVSTEQQTTPHSIIDSTNQSTDASSIIQEEGATTPKSLETTSIVESSEKETTSELSEVLPTKIDEGKQTTTQKSIGSTESYEEDKTEISPLEEVHHSTITPEHGTTELLKQGDEYSTTQKSSEVTESGYTLGKISTASESGEINPSSSKPTEQNPTGQALEQEDGLQTTAKYSESEDTSANEATTLSYDEKIHASTEAPKQIPNESDSPQEDNELSTPKSVDSSGTTSSKSESTTQYSAGTSKQGQESTESITEQAPTEKLSGIETYSTDSPKYEPTLSSITEEELKQTTQKKMEHSEPSEEEKGEPDENSTGFIESTESVGSSKSTSEPILEELSTPKYTSSHSSELPGSEEETTQKTFESTEGEKEVESEKATSSSVSEITTLPSFSDGKSTSSTEKSDSVPSESSAPADESTTVGVLKSETEESISSDTSTELVQPIETESLKPESQEPVESPIKPDTSSTLGEEISSTAPPKESGEKEEVSSTPKISTSPESIHDESTPKAEITSESAIHTDQKESVPELSTTSPADDLISPESSTELSKQETTLASKFSDDLSKSTEGIPAVTQAGTSPISGVEYETTPPSSPEILENVGTTDVNKIEQEISTAKSDVPLGEKDKDVSQIGESASSTETPGMDESSPTTASSVDKESDKTVDTLSGDNGGKLTTIKLSETETSTNNESQEKGTTMQYSPAVSTEKTIIEKESENVTPTKDTEKVSEATTELAKKPTDNEITTSKDFSEADTQRPTTLSHFVPTVTTTTTAQPEKLPSLPDYSEPDYTEESGDEFGPGTCRYGGKVYVSAQQIPRDDPCDFCFCFRSDIICLQQSCPPPIRNCHQEPIRGFCCPRYECPVNMAVSMNLTTTTTTTTTTLPPHFLSHAYKGKAVKAGCLIKGQAYQVGDPIPSASGPCLQCKCGGHGQMECNPVVCSPSPMLEQMLNVAATSKRRR